MGGQQATGDLIAYHPTISLPPDDVASRLERLLDEHLVDANAPAPDGEHAADDDGATAAPGPAAEASPEPEPAVEPAAPAAVAPVDAPVDDPLDELRGQLDDAFNEMADLITRTHGHLGELRADLEAQAGARAQADEELASRLVADRLHLEAALDQLRRDVISWRDAPVTVDTRHLEEEVRQGALHNAADIANMARDVDNLGKTLRLQEERLAELHTTLDWIKQRILNR